MTRIKHNSHGSTKQKSSSSRSPACCFAFTRLGSNKKGSRWFSEEDGRTQLKEEILSSTSSRSFVPLCSFSNVTKRRRCSMTSSKTVRQDILPDQVQYSTVVQFLFPVAPSRVVTYFLKHNGSKTHEPRKQASCIDPLLPSGAT